MAQASWYGCVADGVTDNSEAVNAALANADTSIVELPAGVIGIQSPVIMTSGKTLRGVAAERSVVKAVAPFDKGAFQGAVIYPQLGSSDIGLESLTVDANKLFNGDVPGTANRISGILFELVDGFWARDVHVKNCTGYGHYAAGDIAGATYARNGYYENCYVENCNVNFESQYAYNITYANCHSTNGDNDIPTMQECHFHPYLGCRRITYRDCSAMGTGHGWYLINMIADQHDITLDNCAAVVAGGSGIIVSNDGEFFTHRLNLINSLFESTSDAAAIFSYLKESQAAQSRFFGKTIVATPAFGVVNSATSEIEFTACHAKGEATFGAAGGNGISNLSSAARWNDGKLEGKVSGTATGPAAAMSPPILYSGNTVTIPPPPPSFTEGTPQAVTGVAGTTVTFTSALGWYRVVKTGGTNGGQDGFAGSAVNLGGDFFITVIPRITDDGAFALGVSTAPGGGWSAMEAAFYHGGSGTLSFGVPSAGLSAAGVYVSYEPLHIVRRAGTVSFYKGGATYLQGRLVGIRTDSNAVGFDLSLWKSNATMDVRVGKI